MSVATPVIDYIDGATRRIYLLQGVAAFHWIEDIYREYIHLRATVESLQKWYPFMEAEGNKFKQPGKYSPRLVTLLQGCRVIPYDENILITVTGEAITDDAIIDPDPFDTTNRSQPLKLYITPPASELVRADAELAAIKRMAFNERVAIDPLNVTGAATTSTEFPSGTRQAPAIDITTALAIANIEGYGFKELFLESDLDIDGNYDLDGFILSGNNHVSITLTIANDASVNNVKIQHLTLAHTTLDGDVDISNCIVHDITYVNGHIHDCGISGLITLGGSEESVLESCYTFDQDEPPTIDMGGSGNDLAMPNYSGMVTIRNLHSASEEIGIGLNAGAVFLESSVTAGTVIVAGSGVLYNNSTANVDSSALLNINSIADAIWQKVLSA